MDLLFLNDFRLLDVELVLSVPKHLLLDVVEGKSTSVASEHALDGSACSNLLFETPLDAKHPPVSLNCDCGQPLRLTVFLSVTTRIKF